jgi:DNA recombination protein RmuC
MGMNVWIAAAIGLLVGIALTATALRARQRGRVARLREERSNLENAFRALSAEVLARNNESFLQLAEERLARARDAAATDLETRRRAIDELVRPLADSLAKVDAQLREVERSRAEQGARVEKQLELLASAQATLQAETANLTQALRNPAVRGRWGELQLKRVVEMAGMLEHCDFVVQRTADPADSRLRPDLVVRLPGGLQIVVDAKTPLAAYLAAWDCEDETERAEHLREHARLVRDHLRELGAKSYWEQFRPAPEFVLMFLPGEVFFSQALAQDPSLIEYGVQRRVILASPTTLISVLRAIAYVWQQERVAQNARAISDLGRELCERLRTMTGHFMSLGKDLDRAVLAYNRAIGSLESRVLASARRFAELGASDAEAIPELDVIERQTREISAPE